MGLTLYHLLYRQLPAYGNIIFSFWYDPHKNDNVLKNFKIATTSIPVTCMLLNFLNTRNVVIHYSMQCFIYGYVIVQFPRILHNTYLHITLPLTATITTYGEAALLKSSNKMVMLMWRWWWVDGFFPSSICNVLTLIMKDGGTFFFEVSLSYVCRSTRMYCTDVKCNREYDNFALLCTSNLRYYWKRKLFCTFWTLRLSFGTH